mmetsp:Transcript_24543/g.36810  ORF Transcript_24543/g.36810 Transcript_24543/m.36810 type:complete len:188 (+) Transcript_24543:70-633(+)
MEYITWGLLALAAALILISWVRAHLHEKEKERRLEEEIENEKKAAEERKKLYRDMTKAELKKYHGRDGGAIFLAARNLIFDVTTNPDSYGPDGGYCTLAGRDASRGLGKMSLDEEECDVEHIKDFTEYETETLDQWVNWFLRKYPIVGVLKDGSNGIVPKEWLEEAAKERASGKVVSMFPSELGGSS